MANNQYRSIRRPLDWVYDRLVCEFDHWDICLSGLIEDEGTYKFVEIINSRSATRDDNPEYVIHDLNWNDQCDEYLEDYKVAYKHWFHEGGKRPHRYNGWDLSWFTDKYNHVNILRENKTHG